MANYFGTPGDDILQPPLIDLTQPAYIYGLGGNDIIVGTDLNDLIDGGTGADIMQGDGGSNTYLVDDETDLVLTNTGFDTIWLAALTAITYNMSAFASNTQNLVLFQTSSLLNHNVLGNGLANVITGNNGNNQISGLGGNDTLYGSGGNDNLDGGTGNDAMFGGIGNDTYFVDSPGDTIQDDASDPVTFNTVISSINFVLGAYIRSLVLIGSGDLNGTGNAGNNLVSGTAGKNVLNGGVGADTMSGGGGASGDSFYVDNGGDRVIATGIGDYPNNPSPTGAGVNTIFSSISLNLTGGVVTIGNVYNLVLTGTGNLAGAGNSLGNYVTGNSGNNSLNGLGGTDYLYGRGGSDTLDGGIGNDFLDGGAGADTFITSTGADSYYVDNLGDVVTGNAGGQHRVFASANNYSLATNAAGVRHLTLEGNSPLVATGNSLNNSMVGNSANNQLFGGTGTDSLYGQEGSDRLLGQEGDDLLVGGAGGDRFAFSGVATFADLGVDTLNDFNAAEGDQIQLSRSVFTAFAGQNIATSLSGSQFTTVTSDSLAGVSTAAVVYSSASGKLYYNPDGAIAGFSGGGYFARLQGIPALAGTQLLISA